MQTHVRQNHRLYGFTLIEILVVICIIALLAAILFPVFSVVRERARQTRCASNLRQIGLSVIQYAQDFDEANPCGTFAYEAYANNGAGWARQLHSYIQSREIFKCLSDPKGRSISYIGNSNIFGLRRRHASFVSPAHTVMACEMKDFPYTLTDTYLYNQCPTTNGLAYKFRADTYNNYWGGSGGFLATGWMSGYTSGAQYGRHANGSVYLFADGHVKWLLSQNVSPGQNAANPKAAQVNGDWGNAAGTEVVTHAATFSSQ